MMEKHFPASQQSTTSTDIDDHPTTSNRSTSSLVKEFLSIYFPNVQLNDNARLLLEEKFQTNGVTVREDFDYIEGDDLQNILTTIQIRKFLRKKEQLSTLSVISPSTSREFNSEADLSTSEDSASTSSFFSQSQPVRSINHANKPDWAEHVDLEKSFSKIPAVKMVLDRGKQITSEQRRQLIKTIVSDLRENSERITSSQLRVVAKRIVDKYGVLRDELDGQVVGTGYSSIFNQLINKNDNLNRGKSTKKRTNCVVKEGETQETRKLVITSKDAYGCINFSPSVANADCVEEIRKEILELSKSLVLDWTSIELKLKETYPLQRSHINSGKTVKELMIEWPLLFKKEGIYLHFELLTGIDLLKVYDQNKKTRLDQFFTSDQNSDQHLTFSQLITYILKYFHEDISCLILKVDDTMTVSEVEKLNEKETPRIVVLGASIENSREFLVLVDKVVVVSADNFYLAFLAYFALFYILNIQYPEALNSTLEFFQRCLVGINPLSGSKAAKKRRVNVNSKVLKLINEISNFEWM